jgi:hypothetical protein
MFEVNSQSYDDAYVQVQSNNNKNSLAQGPVSFGQHQQHLLTFMASGSRSNVLNTTSWCYQQGQIVQDYFNFLDPHVRFRN